MELIVTFIVLAVVSAIAYPVITSLATSNQDSIATERIDRIASIEQSFEASFGTFSGWQSDFTTEQLGDIVLVSGESLDANTVSMAISTDGYLSLANLISGNCQWEELAPAAIGGAKVTGSTSTGICSASDHLPDGSSIRVFVASAKP